MQLCTRNIRVTYFVLNVSFIGRFYKKPSIKIKAKALLKEELLLLSYSHSMVDGGLEEMS